MAINIKSGFLKFKDSNGDLNLLMPITTKDNVDGLDEIEESLNQTLKFTAQDLTEEEKAQARSNIVAAMAEHEHPYMQAVSGVAELPNAGYNYWVSIAYGSGKFVAVSQYTGAAYSTDGINWTRVSTSANDPYKTWMSVTYGNGKFVAVSSDGDVSYSKDGMTWLSANLPTLTDHSGFIKVEYYTDKFIALPSGSNKVAICSNDGVNWITSELPASKSWASITYGKGKFVLATTSSAFAYSEDGVNWSSVIENGAVVSAPAVYGNGRFIALRYMTGEVLYSEDGVNWSIASSGLPRINYSPVVNYADGKFIAVFSNSNTAAYSEDGLTWYTTTLPSTAEWRSVTYGNNRFIATASGTNAAAISFDGINWYNEFEGFVQNGKVLEFNAFGLATESYVDTAVSSISHPVNSVNGKTGDVKLTATDVGALPSTTVIPSIVGLATESYVDTAVSGLATESYVDEALSNVNVSIDWNAPEGAPGHVLNRTHWVEGGRVEIPVTGQWVDDGSDTDGDSVIDEHEYMFEALAPLGLEIGKTYTVNWGGVDYTCVAFAFDVGSFSFCSLGNSVNMGGADTGEPFFIAEYPAEVAAEIGFYAMAMSVDLQYNGSFAIYYQDGEVVHKLDPKFLPEGVPYKEKNILLEESEAESYYNSVVSMDIWKVLKAPTLEVGKTYTVKYNGVEYETLCQVAPAGLSDDPNAVGVGNYAAVGGANTGEPFAILVSNLYDRIDVIDLAGSSSVKVEFSETIVNKMAEECLPDTAATQTYVQSYVDEAIATITMTDATSVVIKSSTPDSTKKFKITVDDTGTLTVTEV